jgi:hypothetical protein
LQLRVANEQIIAKLKIQRDALKKVHHWHLELGKVQENVVILEVTLVHAKEMSNMLR